MRKLILFFTLTGILFLETGQAQVSVGIKSAVISNNIKASSGAINLDDLIQQTTGYSIGTYINYTLDNTWSLQGELLFKNTGFQFSEQTELSLGSIDIPFGATIVTSLSYIELPLLVKYQHDMGSVQTYLIGGPSLNYALAGRIKTQATGLLDFNISSTDINLNNNNVNRFGIAGSIGAGLTWPLGNGISMSGEMRYSHDFSSLVQVPVIDAQVQNRGWSIGIGVAQSF